ncbi:hypothetical protein Tco_0297295, partial [Tanacetum coccineum]
AVGTCGVPETMTERSMVRIMQCQMPRSIVATPRGTTQVVTRGNPDPIQTRPGPDPDPTRTRPDPRPDLTWWSTTVDRWLSGGSPPPLATVDRWSGGGPPPLTVVGHR